MWLLMWARVWFKKKKREKIMYALFNNKWIHAGLWITLINTAITNESVITGVREEHQEEDGAGPSGIRR